MEVCKTCFQPYKDKVVNDTTLCEKCLKQYYKHYVPRKEVWTPMNDNMGSDYEPLDNDFASAIDELESDERAHLHKH